MKKVIAAYLRLSDADGDLAANDESNSIKNQRDLIKYHIQSHENLKEYSYSEFVDDGFTGTNTNRPAFLEMIRLIRKNKIHCVIVKDLSRFARDYLVLGDYVEQIFPLLGIRFISINDGYDSLTSVTAMETVSISIKSLVYDYYSKDLSKKRKTGNIERFKHGSIIGQAPYGYVTNYKKHRFEVDPEAAEVVKLIFSLAIEGKKLRQIANHLNECGHVTPAVYNRKHPELHKHSHKTVSKEPLWNYSSVRNIATNISYTGTRIAHRTTTDGIHNHVKVEPSDWFVYENAHEALVSKEDFEAAQKALQYQPKSKYPSKKIKYPPVDSVLKGKLRCGHCGRIVLYRLTGNIVVCPQANMARSTCPDTRYRSTDVETYVYQKLIPLLHALLQEEERIIKEIADAKQKIKTCQQTISRLTENINRLAEKKRTLYESYVTGNITTDSYQNQKEELATIGRNLHIELKQQEILKIHYLSLSIPDEISTLAATARTDLEKDSLTKEMMQTYITAVYIDGINDYRIEWKHKDLFSSLSSKSILENESQ